MNSLVVLLLLLGVSFKVLGAESGLKFRYESRYGSHVYAPHDLATLRHTLDIHGTQRIDSEFSLVGSFRTYVDAAFAVNSSRYSGAISREESYDFSIEDLYFDGKFGLFSLRVGNQQVVWGEAFGFYYADIVNPKDYREFGLGDLSRQRIPTPLLNLKWVGTSFSLQALVIPKPFLNKMPARGSDFASPLQDFAPGAEVTVTEESSLPITLSNVELGLRATAIQSGIDFSVFVLSYFDRQPYYEMSVVNSTPLGVEFRARHQRIYTLGFTATTEYKPFLFRVEALYHGGRRFNTFHSGVYSSALSEEIVSVLGLEYTQISQMRLGLQISQSTRTKPLVGAFLPQISYFATAHFSGNPWWDHSTEVYFSYVPHDGSTLIQFGYLVPLTVNVETGIHLDVLGGNPGTQFGQFRQGSRAYFLLKAFL